MKKLGILVMAMVLVCGMSLGVMAQLAEDDIPIGITADQLATLEHNLDYIDMNIEDLSEGEPFESDTGEFTVEANTPVAISVEQNYTNTNDVFPGRPANQIFWGESNNDNWIIAPNIQIPTINGETTANNPGGSWVGSRSANSFDIGGVVGTSEEVLNFNSGVNTFELYMDVSINEDYEWYDMEAGEAGLLEGNLTVTISAQ